jgi:hypothetical protein
VCGEKTEILNAKIEQKKNTSIEDKLSLREATTIAINIVTKNETCQR